jgi:hypothetical protein
VKLQRNVPYYSFYAVCAAWSPVITTASFAVALCFGSLRLSQRDAQRANRRPAYSLAQASCYESSPTSKTARTVTSGPFQPVRQTSGSTSRGSTNEARSHQSWFILPTACGCDWPPATVTKSATTRDSVDAPPPDIAPAAELRVRPPPIEVAQAVFASHLMPFVVSVFLPLVPLPTFGRTEPLISARRNECRPTFTQPFAAFHRSHIRDHLPLLLVTFLRNTFFRDPIGHVLNRGALAAAPWPVMDAASSRSMQSVIPVSRFSQQVVDRDQFESKWLEGVALPDLLPLCQLVTCTVR